MPLMFSPFRRSSKRKPHVGRARRAAFESLEARYLLATVEGGEFQLSETVDAVGLMGALTASIDWGDGTSGSGAVSGGAASSLRVRFDYSLDSHDFFNEKNRRDVLELAANMLVSNFGDELDAIIPSGSNHWSITFKDPRDGTDEVVQDPIIAENELVIYAGARNLTDIVAIGGSGGWSLDNTTLEFCDVVATRGQPGSCAEGTPTDFGPWGGSITFDLATDWHFGETTVGLDSYESDFLSVAMHEIAHLLGIGTSDSWRALASGSYFEGTAATAANGGSQVELDTGKGHWIAGTMNNGQEAAMDPSLTDGTRKLLTDLDLAGLADVGWELIDTDAMVNAAHTYADDGNYEISVTLSGEASGSVMTSLQETVENSAPLLLIPANRVVATNAATTINDLGTFTDAGFGASETFSYAIDWGDGTSDATGAATIDEVGSPGTPTAGSFDGQHTYSADGVYTVTVTITDDDGGNDSKSFEITASSVTWHNSSTPLDVNGDTSISPLDALVVINDQNANGSRQLSIPAADDVPPYYDVNNDGHATPVDALNVINYLNHQTSAEGEGPTIAFETATLRRESAFEAQPRPRQSRQQARLRPPDFDRPLAVKAPPQSKIAADARTRVMLIELEEAIVEIASHIAITSERSSPSRAGTGNR